MKMLRAQRIRAELLLALRLVDTACLRQRPMGIVKTATAKYSWDMPPNSSSVKALCRFLDSRSHPDHRPRVAGLSQKNVIVLTLKRQGA